MVDDINLIIATVSDTSEDILQWNKDKHETIFDRIEAELKGVLQSLYLSRAVSTTSPSSEGIEVGYEPAQLRKLVDSTKDLLCRVKEEKE